MVHKAEKLVNFIIMKTSIQVFIPSKIIKIRLISESNTSDKNDLLLYDIAISTESGKMGMIRRVPMGDFVFYKIYFDNKPIHTFTSAEYEIFRPYFANDIHDYLNRLDELAKNYRTWKKSENVRRPFLRHVMNGMTHYQQLFHNGGIEKCGKLNKVHVIEFLDEELFETPEIVLCKQDGDHLTKFIYNMN
jgi:hypothetical protein